MAGALYGTSHLVAPPLSSVTNSTSTPIGLLGLAGSALSARLLAAWNFLYDELLIGIIGNMLLFVVG